MHLNLDKESQRILGSLLEDNRKAKDADFLINAYLSKKNKRKSYAERELRNLRPLIDASPKQEKLIRSLNKEGYLLPPEECGSNNYGDNPYYLLLKGKMGQFGDVILKEDRYSPNEMFLLEDKKMDKDVSKLGYFKEGFSYPALYKKDEIWMSLIPHELNTMEKPIKKAKGKVLTLGLGMGYFAFMASDKNEVSSLDIIENDHKIVELFKKELLPLFPHKEKIRIVEADAYSFLRKQPKGAYDFLFADIWHDEYDGLAAYIELKKLESAAKISDYWIEGAILTYLRRFLYALLEESLLGYGEDDYQDYEEEGFEEAIINSLYRMFKNKSFKNAREIKGFLGEESLKYIALRLKLPK